jgi:hypothetical protein
MPSYSYVATVPPKISPFVNMTTIQKRTTGITKLSISDMIHSIFAFLLFIIFFPLMNHKPRPLGSLWSYHSNENTKQNNDSDYAKRK